MLSITDGQCGKCAHFGDEQAQPKLIQVRVSGRAAPDHTESCGHPNHAGLGLRVTALSGCGGFTPAEVG